MVFYFIYIKQSLSIFPAVGIPGNKRVISGPGREPLGSAAPAPRETKPGVAVEREECAPGLRVVPGDRSVLASMGSG